MAKVWVQLKTSKAVEERGKMQLHAPGEWVRVGKQLALEWIKAGDAWNYRVGHLAPAGCGIAVRGEVPPSEHLGLPVKSLSGRLPWPRTLLWDASRLHLRTEILPVGFKLLDRWQVVAPVWHYDNLACHTGGDEDRERTRAVVHDLRVPLYDTRLVFMRRCADTQRLLALWEEERREGGDDKLAFLRALYQVKPTVCAQLASWTQKTV